MSTEDESDPKGGHEMPIEKRWMTAAETGQYLHLHPKSVYRACQTRKLPHAKIPGIGVRIDKQELDAMLERERISPAEYGKRLED
ncbi:MAG: helix-turn-helix domain-containing protein [Methanosarcinaceae archaeon]|nr:helix-turn-helix domain-containing protein [Methanosarcinaceae archaeon]